MGVNLLFIRPGVRPSLPGPIALDLIFLFFFQFVFILMALRMCVCVFLNNF